MGAGWIHVRYRDSRRSRRFLGAVAQLGERGLCKPEVVGSIPISSTIFLEYLVLPFRKNDLRGSLASARDTAASAVLPIAGG